MPFYLHAFQLSSLTLQSWCQRLILLGCKLEQQHSCTAPNTRALTHTPRPWALRNLCTHRPPGRVETPFHPQFPERRWEGSHPQPGNGGAFCEAFPIGSIPGTRSSPGRALWVCSPASQELGWSQRHRARPEVAAGGLQPPRLLRGRAPFIDFAGRQRYF